MYQVTKFLIVASLVVLVTMGSFVSAEAATISGTLKKNGSPVVGGKVTAEATNSYVKTISQSGGTWSMTTLDTPTYTVDGMTTLATHNHVYGVIGSQSGINHNLSSRSLVTVYFKIAADEEFRTYYGSQWQSTANDKLISADPYFREEQSIGLSSVSTAYQWDSVDTATDCAILINEARSESGWNGGTYSGADILAIFTKQDVAGGTACVLFPVPTQGGTHPAFLTEHTTSDMARTIMHEVTHLYGFNHGSCTNVIPNIMATPSTCTNYIKNWMPADDDTMNARQNWY